MRNLMRCMAVILIITFTFSFINGNNIYAEGNVDNNIYEEYIPDEACKYAENNYKDVLGIVLDNYELYGITGSEQDFGLCNPYIVYNVEEKVQDPLYYFPIKDKYEKIVLVMAVFRTEKGWSNSISKDISSVLNEQDYLNNACFIYGDSDDICVENERKQIDVQQVDGKQIEKFTKKSFDNKKSIFERNYKTNFNVNIEESSPDDTVEESTIRISNYTEILLETKNAVVDQKVDGKQKNICWAATIATIYNYVKDRHITAKDVCVEMNHGYSGGNREHILAAYNFYCMDYIYKNSTFDYDRIRSYLKGRKPIHMSTRTADNEHGHGLTLVGIKLSERNQPYITVWNSATESYSSMVYNGTDTSYGMNGKTFFWKYSYVYK